ncbi:hypothetical protein RJT34_15692 [Clitoria ternatea]|uniref:Uncharacterized protein n=1 Tax=Clitoria ternatea TaxID=43366 RepID=A0AAN9J633_CLITE
MIAEQQAHIGRHLIPGVLYSHGNQLTIIKLEVRVYVVQVKLHTRVPIHHLANDGTEGLIHHSPIELNRICCPFQIQRDILSQLLIFFLQLQLTETPGKDATNAADAPNQPVEDGFRVVDAEGMAAKDGDRSVMGSRWWWVSERGCIGGLVAMVVSSQVLFLGGKDFPPSP